MGGNLKFHTFVLYVVYNARQESFFFHSSTKIKSNQIIFIHLKIQTKGLSSIQNMTNTTKTILSTQYLIT
jgi:hypothetical protein